MEDHTNKPAGVDSKTRPSAVAVIVPTYNNPEPLSACLRGLAQQTRRPEAIYIADDGSGESTRRVVQEMAQTLPIRHVWQDDEGFQLARIRNRTVAEVNEPYLVFLDGDTVPHRRFVQDHVNAAHRGRVVLGGRCCVMAYGNESAFTPPSPVRLACLFAAGRVINDSRAQPITPRSRLMGLVKGIRWPRPLLRPGRLNVTHGGNFACWRDDLVAINGFDESFTGWGYEDWDTAERLTRHGCELWQLLGQGVCYHLDHPVNPPNEENRNLFRQTRPMRCESGIDQYLRGQADRVDAQAACLTLHAER